MNRQWFEPMVKAWLPRSGRVTAVDIDGQMLCVAQTTAGGRHPHVHRVVCRPMPSADELDRNDPQQLGRWLKHALDEMKIRTNTVVMGIPRRDVMLKPLKLPAAGDMGELVAMAHWQVTRELPFAAEEALIDVTVQHRFNSPAESRSQNDDPPATEKNADTRSAKSDTDKSAAQPHVTLLAAVTRRTVVDYYRQVAQAAGLKLETLGLRSYAGVACIKACGADKGHQSVALIYIRGDEVLIDVLEDRWLTLSRSASLPTHLDDLPQTPEAGAGTGDPVVSVEGMIFDPLDALCVEVARSLRSYQGMGQHPPIEKVLVAGYTGKEEQAAQRLAERLKLPCEALDPAQSLRIRSTDRMAASSSVAAIGLALSIGTPEMLPFDFLHPSKPAVKRDYRKIKWMAGSAAAAIFLLTTLIVRGNMIQNRQDQLDLINHQISDIRSQERRLRTAISQGNTINEWMDQRHDWLSHWTQLSKALPPQDEVYVTNITTNARGLIRLGLQSRNQETLAELDRKLRDLGYNARPMAVTPGNDRFGYPFSSTVELGLPGLMDIDLDEKPVNGAMEPVSTDDRTQHPAAADESAAPAAPEDEPDAAASNPPAREASSDQPSRTSSRDDPADVNQRTGGDTPRRTAAERGEGEDAARQEADRREQQAAQEARRAALLESMRSRRQGERPEAEPPADQPAERPQRRGFQGRTR